MAGSRTPHLTRLVQALEMRWRRMQLTRLAVDALSLSLGVSLVALLIRAGFGLRFPIPPFMALVNGSALAAALLLTALMRRDPLRFLIDADRAHRLKSLLVSAYEFDRAVHPSSSEDGPRTTFERIVAARAERASPEVDPRVVYPARTPPRIAVFAVLVVAVGTILLLEATGWFNRPSPEYAGAAILVEDVGRRLASRAGHDEELQELADELTRLAEQMQRNQIDADEARRRINHLEDRIEEHIRNLDRSPPRSHDEDTRIASDAEPSIRAALTAGMSPGEVSELFARMRSEGRTLADIIDALEDATPDRAPDATLGFDEDQVRELMDEMSRPPPADESETDLVDDLENSRRVIEQAGAGLADLSEGDERRTGEARGGDSPTTGGDATDDASEAAGAGGGAGGHAGTGDPEASQDGELRRIEGGRVLRELHGIVTEGSIMDFIIRELPGEATSLLTEDDRHVAIERVVEAAVGREEPPAELRRMVRNYFLRLTMTDRGAADEQ